MGQDANSANVIRKGIHNIEYFSGAQVSLYIGDIWVDEVTTLDYSVMQNRTPIYGYASTLYDDVTEGHVLVQGTFTINFKEAGYLWLILNRYRGHHGGSNLMDNAKPFLNSASVQREAVERLVNNETTIARRNELLLDLGETISNLNEEVRKGTEGAAEELAFFRRETARATVRSRGEISASLGGYASTVRALGGIGDAENAFEAFEDTVWQDSGAKLDLAEDQARRTDDPRLNPFDIYVAFGDFAGDNTANHTIERIRDVTLLGKSKRIVIDGMPIQEQYVFLARNLV